MRFGCVWASSILPVQPGRYFLHTLFFVLLRWLSSLVVPCWLTGAKMMGFGHVQFGVWLHCCLSHGGMG